MGVVNQGDIVELVQFGSYQGQTVLNVFHYAYGLADTPNYDAELANLLLKFDQNVWNPALSPWKALVVSDYAVQWWRAQRVNPARDYYIQRTPAGPELGNLVTPGIPSDTNLTISLRTLGIVRGMTGNKKITGVPASVITANLFTPGTVASYQAMAENMKAVLGNLAGNPAWGPMVWSPARPTDRRSIVAVTARSEVRVLRRRQYGKGV